MSFFESFVDELEKISRMGLTAYKAGLTPSQKMQYLKGGARGLVPGLLKRVGRPRSELPVARRFAGQVSQMMAGSPQARAEIARTPVQAQMGAMRRSAYRGAGLS